MFETDEARFPKGLGPLLKEAGLSYKWESLNGPEAAEVDWASYDLIIMTPAAVYMQCHVEMKTVSFTENELNIPSDCFFALGGVSIMFRAISTCSHLILYVKLKWSSDVVHIMTK